MLYLTFLGGFLFTFWFAVRWQSVTEPAVNRILVKRLGLKEAISEVDFHSVAKFFETTLAVCFYALFVVYLRLAEQQDLVLIFWLFPLDQFCQISLLRGC